MHRLTPVSRRQSPFGSRPRVGPSPLILWWTAGLLLLSSFHASADPREPGLGDPYILWTGPSIPARVEQIPFVPELREQTIHEATADGDLITRIFRDRAGNEVPAGTEGAKYTDEYNCDDFATQPEAQRFFERAGGIEGDVNRLDGNKDGVACQALPAGA